ncbi:MAG: PBP1A family penicillin-binding protein [Treponema sp.]|nr:PBP1A family penicillin-binding protein [Treponema sp.]
MSNGSPGRGIAIRFIAALMTIFAIVIGIGLGVSMAETANIRNQENFFEFAPALPTRILDIDGNIITEFAADERRQLVTIDELPPHLIYAVLAREDHNFFNHRGFTISGLARAFVGEMTGRPLGGGSTITQQIAGTLYTNRRERTYTRKLRELWWAFQMERRFTKNEILEIYLNQIIMGPGVFGVEAASQFFFGHSARDISLAEAAILVVQFSSPTHFNPLNNPNQAMLRQRNVLNRMIELGFTTPEEADASFVDYWDNYDFTRASMAAYFHRTDAAPWFSEHVRRELDRMMYGTMDYYRDGFTVHTTLNQRHQEAAVRLMDDGIRRANVEYERTSGRRLVDAERTWVPIVDLFSLFFDFHQIHDTFEAQNEQRALSRFDSTLNPIIDMAALVFGIQDLRPITIQGFANDRVRTEQNIVEGALISVENDTGYITAIVGGSRYDETNQFIRATQGSLQPGSAFKPLYYSAAIDSLRFTATSRINDMPIVFHNEDGTPYMPLNFMGEWAGSVLLYDALARSMNIPSLSILDSIGFDAAIDRSASLLGITNPDEIRARFPRVFPLGLGIISTSPLRMATAFATFSNQGREVAPLAIRYMEDRNGRVILDLERELRQEQRRRGNAVQIVSPQNAYIMNSLLKRTVEAGTLFNPSGWGSKFTFRNEDGSTFRMPMAGKTGTSQNWADAWTVGYSPYYTTAIWFGFDLPGNSLGLTLTGSTLAGHVWADYMREIHLGLPFRDFVTPASGIIDVSVCTVSGLLRTPSCNTGGTITMPFLEGTQPLLGCDIHGVNVRMDTTLRFLDLNTLYIDRNIIQSLQMPVIRDEEIFRMPALPRPLFVEPFIDENDEHERVGQSLYQADPQNPTDESGDQEDGILEDPEHNPFLD